MLIYYIIWVILGIGALGSGIILSFSHPNSWILVPLGLILAILGVIILIFPMEIYQEYQCLEQNYINYSTYINTNINNFTLQDLVMIDKFNASLSTLQRTRKILGFMSLMPKSILTMQPLTLPSY